MAGYHKHEIIPQARTAKGDYGNGKQVFSFKLSDSLLEKIMSSPHQLSLKLISPTSAIFTGSEFEQEMELISEGQKTKPVECYQREGSTFHEVGPVTHKCKFPNTEADASLINHLVKIREEEEQLKDSKKTQKEETVQRKKRGRSFVTVTDQPPRKVQVISSPTKPSVKVIPIKSGPIEDLRIQLIKLLAASSRSERDVFRHCKDYSSSNVLKVLNDIGMSRNSQWHLNFNNLTKEDLENKKLTDEDQENINKCMLAIELEPEPEPTLPVLPLQTEPVPEPEPVLKYATPKDKENSPQPRKKTVSNPYNKPPSPRSSSKSRRSRTPSTSSKDNSESSSSSKKRKVASSPKSISSIIKTYESKKQEYDRDYKNYQRYYKYLQDNATQVKDLGEQWENSTDRGKKVSLAEQIKTLHDTKRNEVHQTAKKCGILVQRLSSLKKELEELSINIKDEYKKSR